MAAPKGFVPLTSLLAASIRVTSLEPTLKTAIVCCGGESAELMAEAALVVLGLALAAAADGLDAAAEGVAWPAIVCPQAANATGARPASHRKRRLVRWTMPSPFLLTLPLKAGGGGMVGHPFANHRCSALRADQRKSRTYPSTPASCSWRRAI